MLTCATSLMVGHNRNTMRNCFLNGKIIPAHRQNKKERIVMKVKPMNPDTKATPCTHVDRITKNARHSGIFSEGIHRTPKTLTLEELDAGMVNCLQCGNPVLYTEGTCPHCGYVEFK